MRYGPQAYGYDVMKCMNACPLYQYVALQDNGQCFCDNDLSHSTK